MARVLYRNTLKHSRIINAPLVAIIFLLFCFSSPCLSYFPVSIILIWNSFFFPSFICSFVTLYEMTKLFFFFNWDIFFSNFFNFVFDFHIFFAYFSSMLQFVYLRKLHTHAVSLLMSSVFYKLWCTFFLLLFDIMFDYPFFLSRFFNSAHLFWSLWEIRTLETKVP